MLGFAHEVDLCDYDPFDVILTDCECRFEDEDASARRRPATADAARTMDDDWLGLGASSGTPTGGSKSKRPLGLASTIDFSAPGTDDDWLDLASGSKTSRYLLSNESFHIL